MTRPNNIQENNTSPPLLSCPHDGAKFTTVEAFGNHLWVYHGNLSSNIAIAKMIFELIAQNKQSLPSGEMSACPFCADEVSDDSQDQEKNFWIHLAVVHRVSSATTLIKLINSERGKSIPISKIRGRIKKLEDSPAPQWKGRWEILEAKLEELEALLPKDKELPEGEEEE